MADVTWYRGDVAEKTGYIFSKLNSNSGCETGPSVGGFFLGKADWEMPRGSLWGYHLRQQLLLLPNNSSPMA